MSTSTPNPAAYDVMAQEDGSVAGDPSATSHVLHPPGSSVPEAAHHSPGTKLEEAVEAGLSDADPVDRPHGNPDTWTP